MAQEIPQRVYQLFSELLLEAKTTNILLAYSPSSETTRTSLFSARYGSAVLGRSNLTADEYDQYAGPNLGIGPRLKSMQSSSKLPIIRYSHRILYSSSAHQANWEGFILTTRDDDHTGAGPAETWAELEEAMGSSSGWG